MTDYSELKRLAENYLRLIDDEDSDSWMEASDAYDDASGANTVLALIAELELAQTIGRLAYNFDGYKAVLEERDRLRAEVAGLRTGYEAYEQVNAELKAEVELLRGLLGQSALAATTLRTDAEAYANHSGFNRVFVDLIRSRSGVEVGHGYGSSKYPQQADVVAALGKGEQS